MAYAPDVKIKYFQLRKDGWSNPQACDKLGINHATGLRWEQSRAAGALDWLEKKAEDALPNPKLPHDLDPEPLRALDDFEYWRHRYMGRKSKPWQAEAAHNTVSWLDSDETELIVVNLPPGAGKTTLFTCDIPLWQICRNRAIREFLGHRVRGEAEKYARRMRRALERTRPLPPSPDQGRMEAAEGCLAQDYGRFRPRTGDVWRADEFTVLAEFDGEESIIEDKEATVTAKGMGTEFLGMRSEFVVWDDLITQQILQSIDQLENQRTWWDNEAVTRVEPGGCLLLVGQRMGPEDLYGHCLTERIPPNDAKYKAEIDKMSPEDYLDWLETVGTRRYKHIVFPAHFDDRCKDVHYIDPDDPDAPETLAYPHGCLLDPDRIPYIGGANSLLAIQSNNPTKYLVQYQQEDAAPEQVLVPKLWIEGGIDKDGIVYPGCLDKHRGLCELPKGLSPPIISVASVDPSPTQYWSIEWWLYHPASEQRFLMDLKRQRMGANEWLDWNENSKNFYGIAHDWQLRSQDLGYPITHWIFEQNAAQRFVLQFDHVHRWMRKMRVQVLAHNTTIRKLDEEFGIQMLRDRYRLGNVRLPYALADKQYFGSPAKTASDHLIREATTYPQGITTDCLMAQYFFEYNLAAIAKSVSTPKRGNFARRPSFMRERAIA